ncbi:hypothetical protein [Nocardiopsis ganjiahuensis]|uniref:hypothetical protein n=1 Tax=Nocardiopsis ganjiahuensis TaxID=239984 RepID=UPI0003484B54|nr:hypothetical protein [Nocardiopsis ganjiahuensis]
MHPDFTAQAADMYRAEAELAAHEARLAHKARQHRRDGRDQRGRRSGSVRTTLRSVLGLAA